MKWLLGFILTCATLSAQAQASFVNLNFEDANLTPVPAGQYGGPVSSLDAIPGWTGFLGTTQVSQVLQNNLTLGNASIDILSPNWNNFNGISTIEGQYTVILQAGFDPFGSGHDVGASISQSDLVPANAQSLQFKASANNFSVSFGGQNLSLVTLGTGANYTLYGADISSFAGLSGALTIATSAQTDSGGRFDSFLFSPSPVPEPSGMTLIGLGSAVLGFNRWRRRSLR
jgi:hypothetical protein